MRLMTCGICGWGMRVWMPIFMQTYLASDVLLFPVEKIFQNGFHRYSLPEKLLENFAEILELRKCVQSFQHLHGADNYRN